MSPKVSIIMGVYNGAKQLARSIQSIQEQTLTDWEFIICDDHSTDESYELLQSFAANDPRIRVIKNQENLGLAQTLNKCLAKSSGQYIARQDHDDFSHKTRLEKQVMYLESNPTIDLVATKANLVDEKGNKWGELGFPKYPNISNLVRGSCFIHPTILIKKSTIETLSGYNPKALRVEDYELWFRFMKMGFCGVNLEECLFDYTIGKTDYAKRKYKFRINEFKIRLHGYRLNNISRTKWFWAFKPLVVGLIPNKIIYYFNRIKFSSHS